MNASVRESSARGGSAIAWVGAAVLALVVAACGEVVERAAEGPDGPATGAPNVDAPPNDASGEGVADGPAILCFGDSLTAGYGLDPEDAWPAVLARRLADSGRAHRMVNAGSSGETTTGGLRRLDWVLNGQADVAAVVLALGGNDGLRGISVDLMEANLEALIERVRALRPEAVIVLTGMESPPNMGADYTAAFRAVFPRLAARHDTALVPFLLEGVGGEPALNQSDGIHPNVAGQRIVADNVWAVLEPLLAER